LKPKDLTGRQLILRARRDPGLLRRFIQGADVIGRSLPKIGLDHVKGGCCTATIAVQLFGGFCMDEIVDRALHTYGLARELDAARIAQSREKIIRYIGTLGSAGQNDTHQLAVYALAYLKELHEGPDPRFTGC
jgi:hypothetical protein